MEYPRISKHCQNCPTTTREVSQCSQCKVVFYCSRRCQQQHWNNHKSVCQAIEKAKRRYENEEKALFDHDGHNYFADPRLRTRFWGLHETRPFCRSVYGRIEAYTRCNTEASIKEALKLCFKHLYHCRGDNLGIRGNIPALLLRLRMNQQCFDFVKWYEEYPDASYNWRDASAPYLSYWGMDMSLPVSFGKYSELPLCIGDVILKHRLLVLLQQREAFYTFILALRRSNVHGGVGKRLAGTDGVLEHIYLYLLGNQLRGTSCKKPAALSAIIYKTMKMGEAINVGVWRAIANPRPLLALARPQSYSPGSREEMQLQLESLQCLLPYMRDTQEFIKAYCMKEHGNVDYPRQDKPPAFCEFR